MKKLTNLYKPYMLLSIKKKLMLILAVLTCFNMSITAATIEPLWECEAHGVSDVVRSSIGFGDKIYVSNVITGCVEEWHKGNKTKEWNVNQFLSSQNENTTLWTAITCDDFGNILVNIGGKEDVAGGTKWLLIPADGSQMQIVEINYPSKVTPGRIDYIGRVIGNLLDDAYAVFAPSENPNNIFDLFGPNQSNNVVLINLRKDTNGQVVSDLNKSRIIPSKTACSIGINVVMNTTYREISSLSSVKDVGPKIYLRNYKNSNLFMWNGNHLTEQKGIGNDGCTARGFDVFTIKDVDYYVVPCKSSDGRTASFEVRYLNTGDVAAQYSTNGTEDSEYSSYTARVSSDGKSAVIYAFNYKDKIGVYTFKPDGYVELIQDLSIDSDTTLKVGETAVLNAMITPSNATNKMLSWVSMDESIATVDNNGMISAIAPGNTKIIATTTDGTELSDTCAVTVIQLVQDLKIDTDTTLNVGETAVLKATITPENATNKTLIWASNNIAVATVINGTVTALSAGTATITATTTDGTGLSAACTVTVKYPTIYVQSISIEEEKTLNVGETTTITATISPSNASNKSLNWTSLNTDVATVSNGVVTAKSIGTATITATTTDGTILSDTCVVTVVQLVETLTIDSEKTLNIGETATITATILPDNASNKSLNWHSLNTDVATVSNGVVTAKSVGTATITATTTDGTGLSAACTVTVKYPTIYVQSISIEEEKTLNIGETATITATISPSNASNKSLNWTSLNTDVATVSNGVVTAKSVGTATITATTTDGTILSDTCVITVVQMKLTKMWTVPADATTGFCSSRTVNGFGDVVYGANYYDGTIEEWKAGTLVASYDVNTFCANNNLGEEVDVIDEYGYATGEKKFQPYTLWTCVMVDDAGNVLANVGTGTAASNTCQNWVLLPAEDRTKMQLLHIDEFFPSVDVTIGRVDVPCRIVGDVTGNGAYMYIAPSKSTVVAVMYIGINDEGKIYYDSEYSWMLLSNMSFDSSTNVATFQTVDEILNARTESEAAAKTYIRWRSQGAPFTWNTATSQFERNATVPNGAGTAGMDVFKIDGVEYIVVPIKSPTTGNRGCSVAVYNLADGTEVASWDAASVVDYYVGSVQARVNADGKTANIYVCGHKDCFGILKFRSESEPTVAVESLTIDSEKTLNVGETATITATILPDNATNKVLEWYSSNDSIATISNGTVTAHSLGTVKITAKTTNNLSDVCIVTVVKATELFSIENNRVIGVGETADIKVKKMPETNDSIGWESSDESIATVYNGIVSAVSEGTVKIVATTTDGSNLSDTCIVTVVQETISLGEVRIYINPGHGSWTANDRPFGTVKHGANNAYTDAANDTTNFFESNTNLQKAFGVLEKLIDYGVPFDRTKNQNNDNSHRVGAALDLTQNIVMSHVKCGASPAYIDYTTHEENPDNDYYNRSLSEIAAEVETNYFDMFISIHSNAHTDGSTVNYLYFAIDGYGSDDAKDALSKEMSRCGWNYSILDRHQAWTHYDYTMTAADLAAGKGKIAKQQLGVLRHDIPGYLVEGHFFTYQPARHRAMNWDVCRQEGVAYARGIADYFGWEKESTGDIYGVVRDLYEEFTHEYYNAREGTNDVYLPLNNVQVTLVKEDVIIDTYSTDDEYNGAFVFTNLEPGTYTLEFYHEDYNSVVPVTVTVSEAETSYPSVFLEKIDSANSSETVTNVSEKGKGSTAVETIKINDSEEVIEYYNLQGMRVENPEKGIYIKKQGSKATKVILK